MSYTYYELTWLFFAYSLAGWCVSVAAAAVKRKTFVNTGVLNLPLCPIYGVLAVAFSVFLAELKHQFFFLFLGGMVITAVLTVATGVVLQRIFRRKWWNPERFRLDEDGYVTVPVVLLGGVYSIFVLWLGNTLVMDFVSLMLESVGKILLLVISGLFLVDIFSVLTVVWKWRIKIRQLEDMTENMQQVSQNVGNAITRYVRSRLEKSYPNIQTGKILEEQGHAVSTESCFAEGCCFYKLAAVFIISAFIGDIVEMIFCRLTMGYWMSRSSLVYGQFSVVWGFGCVLLTAMLYKYRDKSDRYIFIYGTVLGGAYEYLCSVGAELLFGASFWDYSGIPFNLGGRVNLLYCFFWGIAAVVWLKGIYPYISSFTERIPKKTGTILIWIGIVFMIVDMVISSAALMRYSSRKRGQEPSNAVEQCLDEHFPDDRMERVYPKAKLVD